MVLRPMRTIKGWNGLRSESEDQFNSGSNRVRREAGDSLHEEA